MKRIAMVFAVCTFLFVSATSATAGEYLGYLTNYWVESNGDLTFYLDSSTGLCGSTVYKVRKSQSNFNELYPALMLALAKGYEVDLVVTSCTGSYNYVDFAKICNAESGCN
ncbi:MAG: hypothetical protein M0P97_00240 [Candidatus Moranbacteria bacterium]|jgi:hypothetical protein|nr:hypothetical protein [Candidatus Moranbacteria bacterium]